MSSLQGCFLSQKEICRRRWSLFRNLFPLLAPHGKSATSQTYSDLRPYFKKEEFVPKVFGFKLEPHEDAIFKPMKEQENTEVLSNNVMNVESESKPNPLKKKNKKKKNKQQEMEAE